MCPANTRGTGQVHPGSPRKIIILILSPRQGSYLALVDMPHLQTA